MAHMIKSAVDIAGSLELNKKELKNPQLHQSSTDILAPVKGQCYFNTSTNKLRVFNGTTWDEMPEAEGPEMYVHNQYLADSVWNIVHNLNKYPSVTVTDSANNVVVGDVTYVNENAVTITFGSSFGGKAYLN